jgi:gliding motility-associated-like protein
MKFIKILLSIIFYSFTLQCFAQTITVDDTRNPNNLVNLLVGNSCAAISNVSISSNQSVAYFNQNGSTFPIHEGVLIRSGIASQTQGLYTGTNLDTQVNTNSDIDLQRISNNSGQVAKITDVAFLEFDFVPPSTNFNFNFLFSSNEYGEWQCGFSDVFAFILTDLVTGEKINLAVVPASGNPISIKEIRDNQYNPLCNSVNPELFGTYNVDNPSSSTLNMRGHTVVMNASATIKPNNPYNIKLVIGDYNDSKYDSAVFIEAGSFGNFLDLGDDFSMCAGETTTLNSGFTNTTDYTFEWRKDTTTISGENSPTLNIATSGTYELLVTNKITNCVITDQIVVADLIINNPPDLLECDNGIATVFDLTQNNINTLGLDPLKYQLEYFASQNDLNSNTPINNSLISNYQSPGGSVIFGRVTNINSSNTCTQTIQFLLNTKIITATKPTAILTCENAIIDLPTTVNSQILNGLNSSNYSISFYTNNTDAQNNTNAIPNPNQYTPPIGINAFTLWARLSENGGTECVDLTDINVTVNPSPEVDLLDSQYSCSSYTLTPLINGNYFTGPNGTGTQLNAGDVITDTTPLFIYNEVNGCSSETSFIVTIIEDYTFETQHCGSFIVPSPDVGNFYTAPNGPNGTGTIVNFGTVFTTSQTLYFYADACVDNRFDFVVHPLPLVDTLSDIVTCITYSLPTITNGNYFTEPNGQGTQLSVGDAITTTQKIYIFNSDVNSCTNESSFDVSIIDTTVFQDTTVCGTYTIPTTDIGNFFSQTGGLGTSFNSGDVITTTQTIFFYAPTSNGCADDIPMQITINPLPPVDTLAAVTTCIDSPYSLPALTNGNYFTQSGGLGNPLNAGDVIASTQTIFIYNFDGTCPNETSFTVDVRPLPPLNSFTDVFSCAPYALPTIANGKYYSQTNAQGVELLPGTIINTTQTIFIYNVYDDLKTCSNEAFFTIHIIGITVDKPDDITACDSYTLPFLNSGNYFTEPNGQGVRLNAGDVISTTQTLFIFKDNGSRYYCSDEHQFTISISSTPQLPIYAAIESCDRYVLPTLTSDGNVINYYRQPNKVDLIDPSEYTITSIGTQTIYVHVFAIGNENCFDETQFELTIFPLLDLFIEGGIICVDSNTKQTLDPFVLQSGLDPAVFRVNWYLENQLVGTGENYAATKAGTYTVETIKLTPDIGAACNYKPTQVIVRESAPEAKVTFLTSSFKAPANIRVDFIQEGFGNYLFKLDNGSYQTSNLFHDLDYGEHVIYILDTTGICSNPLPIHFKVINHPNFFTPNNDSENETWNIPDLINHPEAEVRIFDRYGKLITSIKPSGTGWNGTYQNGSKAPSTDYWFTVTFLFQGKPATYSSNFSLIRND